jgi:hypothetical protein
VSSTPPAAGDGASPFFADARGCKAWLGGLAVSNQAQALSSVLDALRVFNRATFDPLERLKSLELVRDRVAFMVGEQRTRVFARPLPHGAADVSAWETTRHVLEELEGGYRRALALPELAPHAALATQRIVRYIAAQMLLHAVVYRTFDNALWQRLHQSYAGAERAGIAEDRVKDSLEAEGGASSVAEAYAQAVLLEAAGLHEMHAAQVQFAEALLKLWGRKLKVLKAAPAESAALQPVVVDLAGSQGAAAAPIDSLAGSQRVIFVDELARSLRRRIRVLQAGEDAASLGLPAAGASVDLAATLQALAKRWCEPSAPEAALGSVSGKQAGLVLGLNEAHFFLSGGKAFEQPGKERVLTAQENNDLAVFGRVTERTQSMMATAGPSFTLDSWDVVAEGLGAMRLRRRTAGSRSATVGRLAAVRTAAGAPFQLGVVRALFNQAEGIEAVVAFYPGKPEPLAARATGPWVQAIGLPAIEKLGVPPTLVVPTAMASRGRALQVRDGQDTRDVKVQEVLEREAEFARVVAGA